MIKKSLSATACSFVPAGAAGTAQLALRNEAHRCSELTNLSYSTFQTNVLLPDLLDIRYLIFYYSGVPRASPP